MSKRCADHLRTAFALVAKYARTCVHLAVVGVRHIAANEIAVCNKACRDALHQLVVICQELSNDFFGRITPAEWERRRGMRLRFVYRRCGPSLLVADGRLNSRGLGVASRAKTGRGRSTVPIFLLVPQVKLAKRLHLARDAEWVQAAIQGRIVANWVEHKSGF